MLITHRGQGVSQVNIATATASSQNYIKLFMMVNKTASSPSQPRFNHQYSSLFFVHFSYEKNFLVDSFTSIDAIRIKTP